MSELKKCPFCGSKDVNIEYDPITGTYVVRCRACQCVVWQYYALEEEAAEAWNKRADDRPRGEWEIDKEYYKGTLKRYKCSACGKADYYKYNFCQHCGADMRKAGE